MHLETDLAEPLADGSPRFAQVAAAAEHHARKIVRDAEDEACRILEEAAAVAFRSNGEAARPRRYAVFTLLLAGCALAATAGLIVGIAIGQM